MTTVDVSFGYTRYPDETTLRAVNAIREVYGIRKIAFKEADQTVTVEYDATRLTPAVVRQLLRRAGLDAVELPPPVAQPATEQNTPASVTPVSK